MACVGGPGVDSRVLDAAHSQSAPPASPPSPESPAFRRSRPERPDPYDASWRERLLVLGTATGIVVAALVLGLIFAHDATIELLGLIPLSMFAVGKFLPLWGVTGKSNFGPWELGLVIGVIDTCTVLFIVYALEGLYRFARLKRALEKVQANASLVLTAYPRIKKGAVVGVALFVLFPVAGTGAMMGAFLGILLGLHRYVTIAAVAAGGFIGGMLMAFLAAFFRGAIIDMEQVQHNPVVKWSTIAVLVLLGLLALRWLTRTYRRALEAAQQQGAGPNA